METTWNKVKAEIKRQIPVHSYRMWIEPLEFVKCQEGVITLSCPNFFSKKRVQDHYGALIKSEANKIFKKAVRFSIETSVGNTVSKSRVKNSHQLPLPNFQMYPNQRCLLRRDFTFEQFVVGGNNDFAYSASLALASKKNTQQNSLFLLSKTGLGKSHLSQAIGHHILAENASNRVFYVTVEEFSNEMIQAFRNGAIDKFKKKYRENCDVLLLEDVHYLTGKARTQIELAYTLDTLYEAGKKIIFSSCYLPADIPKLNDKLRSRLSYGIISNIDPPNFRTRVRILQKKVQLNGYKVPEEVSHYLAGELTEDVRQLESGLIGVTAKASLLGAPIDLNLAESVVRNIVRHRKNITIDAIKKLVCKHFRISVKEIVSTSRKQSIVRPRQIAMYLARRYTDSPLQVIGKSFNRYHATALHSIGIIERELKGKGPVREQVEFFRLKLETGEY